MTARRAGAVTALWAAAAAQLGGGCSLITDSFLTNEFSGDPFPVRVDASRGAVLVGARPGDAPASADRRAVLDLLSPFTLFDPGTTTQPSLTTVDLLLLGKDGAGALTMPRARFPEVQLLSLHPCAIPAQDGSGSGEVQLPACSIGAGDDLPTFDAVIGADALAGDAVRLRLPARAASGDAPDDQIFVLADIGGSNRGRTLSCEAVFGSPYRGGGTLTLSGTELPFGNRRITIAACLGQDEEPDLDSPPLATALRQHGADVLFVVSTSIGISILGRSAYDRYITAVAADTASPPPAFDQLTGDSVYLPSGKVDGRRATVNRLALVAASSANALSPCRQVYAHRLLSMYALSNVACQSRGDNRSPRDCPCKNGDLFCLVPAIVEIVPQDPAAIDVLVVEDDNPTLQALRTELRPDQPEVDGILGTEVLRGIEIDADYPHDRLLARCTSPSCLIRPELERASDVCQIKRCITGEAVPPGCADNPLRSICEPDDCAQ